VLNGRRETVRPASIGASFDEASKKWRKPSKSIDNYGLCNYYTWRKKDCGNCKMREMTIEFATIGVLFFRLT